MVLEHSQTTEEHNLALRKYMHSDYIYVISKLNIWLFLVYSSKDLPIYLP